MGKTKVLLLGPLPPPVMGPTLATEVLLKSRLRDDFRIIHLDTSDHRDLTSLGAVDVRNVFLGIRHLVELAAAAVSRRPDLVYVPVSQTTRGFLRDALFILAARLLGRKVVCHLRGGAFRDWVDGSSALNRAFVRFVLRRTQGVIVLGESLRQLFDGYADREKVHVVPNGADYGPPPERPASAGARLLFLGSLKPAKGIEDVIAAMALLKTEGGNVTLDVAGQWRDEGARRNCLALCRRENLAVTFHPPVTGRGKDALFAAADIFVFPPRGAEGHPWVIIEAMAAGLPVISTDRGAIAESVSDGENGYIVAAGEPEEIAAKVRLLAADPDLRHAMGRRSRELYEERFTEERMTAAMAAAFRAAAGEGS